MKTDNEIKELINLYIFDALDADEKAEAEEYLNDPAYNKYYRETKFILDESALSIEDSPLPENLKAEVFSKIGEVLPGSVQEPEQLESNNVIRPSFFNRYGYAIAATVIGFLLIYTFSLSNQLKEQQVQIAALQKGYEENHHFVDFVNNPDVFQVKLTAEDKSKALGNLAWDKKSNDAMLYVSNLMEPPGKSVYQVWVVHKDNSIVEAMGTFRVNEDGTYMLTIGCMPDPSDTKAIFITMEPEGGMPEPTGNKYLSGYL